MKIDNVYIVDLFIVESRKISGDLNMFNFEWETRFLKKTLVYNEDNDFIDLRTGKEYKVYDQMESFNIKTGDIIINPKYAVIPFRQFINMYNGNNDKQIKIKDNMTKRKILKILNNGGNNEKSI